MAAPIVKPLLGKDVVPDDSPYTTGGIGLLGTEPSEIALERCDTLLMAGTSFPYLEFYPKHDDCRGVQIDRDSSRIGLRFPVEVGLCGDARSSLQVLIPHVRRREDRSFLESAQTGMTAWRELLATRSGRDDVPMKPQVVAHALNELLADDAIISTDSGTITTWAARYIHIKRVQRFSCSGNLASMAPGLPYAIAAQIAYPGRQTVAFVGDGGFTMLMGEFVTAVKYRLPIKVVIIKNNTLGMIKWEQMVFLGNPEYGVSLEPHKIDRFERDAVLISHRKTHPLPLIIPSVFVLDDDNLDRSRYFTAITNSPINIVNRTIPRRRPSRPDDSVLAWSRRPGALSRPGCPQHENRWPRLIMNAIERVQRFSCSGKLASSARGLPYPLAAQSPIPAARRSPSWVMADSPC